MMASWGDFMDYQPDRDDRFEEGERKSRGKFTWKTRLRQLNSIVQYGLQKEEIMGSLPKIFKLFGIGFHHVLPNQEFGFFAEPSSG